MYCYIKSFWTKNKHGDRPTRFFDETSFIIAYVNCVLKVNANEVFLDQDELERRSYQSAVPS